MITPMIHADENTDIEGDPEFIMPGYGAILDKSGNLTIFALDPMIMIFDGWEFEIIIEPVFIEDFYTPVKGPGFFRLWVVPPLVCVSTGIIATAIGGAEEAWQYVLSGAVGIGAGLVISIILNRSYK